MKTRIGMLLVAGVCQGLLGQEAPRAYTLEECIRIGVERSGLMANARRDQAIAGAQITQARAQAIPRLNTSAAYTRLDEVQAMDVGGESVPMGTLDNYSVQAEINQLLYSGGKVGAALKAASLAARVADFALADAEAMMVRDIRTLFYDILLAQAAVRVREQSVEQIRSLVRQTDEKLTHGKASEFESLTVRVRLANEIPMLLAASNQCDVALENFKRVLNATDEVFRVEGQLAFEALDADLDALQKAALRNRPGILGLESAASLKEQDVTAAKAEYQPTLKAFFMYNGANSYRFASYDNDWEWHWSAGASVQWNLWDGGLTAGTVRQKRLELDKMRTNVEELRKAVCLEIKQAYLDLTVARKTVEAGTDTVSMAKKALEIAKTRYDSGMATYVDYTDANLALRAAELTLNRAVRDHMQAVARLDYAVGGEVLTGKRNAAK